MARAAYLRVYVPVSGSDGPVLEHVADHSGGTRVLRDSAFGLSSESRKPQYDEAEELLSAVIDASEAQAGVDNITLNMTMQRMANVQFSADKKKEARATLKRMVAIFESKSLKSNVLSLIKEQVAEIRSKF